MSDTPIISLLHTVVDHFINVPDDWTAISLVMLIDTQRGRCEGTSGYAYHGDDGYTPIAASPRAVQESLFEYLASQYGANDALPAAVLLQFDRSTGHYEVTFEDSNKERWKVSPDNVTTMQETLRPAFPKE